MRKIIALLILLMIMNIGALSGCTETDDRPDCPFCGGTGCIQWYINGQPHTEACPRCEGTGKQG